MHSNLYFELSSLPKPNGEYVFWCDGMGTSNELSRSLTRAAGFVFKIHMAFAIAKKAIDEITIYPVMDGLYITSKNRKNMRDVIRIAYSELAREFIHRGPSQHMFMLRGGLAYGPVIHGKDVMDEAFGNIEGAINSKSSVLLSPAMVNAYHAETYAPPYGVYVDDTAKYIPCLTQEDDNGFISNLWQWWRGCEEATKIAELLYNQIEFYLEKCEVHSIGMGYKKESIEKHRALALEYFGGFKRDGEHA